MEQYKAQLRIPTQEQFAFIEVSCEGTPEFIVESYHTFTHLVKPQIGLPTKEFNGALDRYLNDGTGDVEVYMAMSPAQKEVFQCIKRSFKRIESKNK